MECSQLWAPKLIYWASLLPYTSWLSQSSKTHNRRATSLWCFHRGPEGLTLHYRPAELSQARWGTKIKVRWSAMQTWLAYVLLLSFLERQDHLATKRSTPNHLLSLASWPSALPLQGVLTKKCPMSSLHKWDDQGRLNNRSVCSSRN